MRSREPPESRLLCHRCRVMCLYRQRRSRAGCVTPVAGMYSRGDTERDRATGPKKPVAGLVSRRGRSSERLGGRIGRADTASERCQPWPAPRGLRRLAYHGGRSGPCITSRQLERSTDHTGCNGLSQCGQHTHSTASVVSVSAGGSGGSGAATSGHRDRHRATYLARCP
jgi:hypothetical protein